MTNQFSEIVEIEDLLEINQKCNHHDCSVSTAIDEETYTFGRGDLDPYGFWETPCVACARFFLARNPEALVWPLPNLNMSISE